ncbi:MAG: GNAT family N-acetyltransferase [Lachnospiraceae bacterium]|nr:GNAT family N-acetyltransferase [Lachnospiraceae bacterium]
MVSLEAYLENPCGTLSIPYWKNKITQIPENMKIVHHRDYLHCEPKGYDDEPYFRLLHTLKDIKKVSLAQVSVRTASDEEFSVIADIINRSYSDISVTYEQISALKKSKVYNSSLWVIAYEKESGLAVGCGIAELDHEAKEGVLEWIQVLPEYRGQGIGQLIVTELLIRLQDIADFVTVSGKVNNPSNPEILYRKCGFEGEDIWHIMRRTEKRILYHASSVAGITHLQPRVSNHGIPQVYFSTKRENTLVYLSNAVEKYCRETRFEYDGVWSKWGSYGFNEDGILRLEEYYPNAMEDTYKGVSGYIYSTSLLTDGKELKDVPFAVTADRSVEVEECEFVPDAYEAIMEAVSARKMTILRYGDVSEKMKAFIRNSVQDEYEAATEHPEYRHFLKGKFEFLNG